MRNTLARALVAAGMALMALAGPALADEERKFGYSVTMAATSDYMFRGISTNDENPAFQPYVEFTYGIAYVALWGTNITGDYGPWETDVYMGIRPVTGPVSWDIAAWYYFYPGGNLSAFDGGDYWEFRVAGTVTPVTNLSLTLAGYFTPDQGAAYVETGSVELTANYTLPQWRIFTPTIGGLIGYTTADSDNFFLGLEDDYTYWNFGLKLGVEKFYMDIRYWDTTIDSGLADERVVFSAGVTLP
jgi:uncharacterized protein (TIGR02001 family)